MCHHGTNTSLLSCFCCWWRHCLLSIIVYFPLSFFVGFMLLALDHTLHLPYLTSFLRTFCYLKVRPHYAARHKAAECGKAAWQKLRHATSICGPCAGLAVACRSMLCGLKIWSTNCQSHQKKPRGIWWVRGFKMVSANLRKKSHQVRRFCSTVLVTWKRSAKNSFFMWTRSHWRHIPSNFCRTAKLQCVAFCHAA